jgi:hypothetical protein
VLSAARARSIACAQLLSLGTVIIRFVWLYEYMGGLGWTASKNFFNLHPFFMVLGVGFFLTNGETTTSHGNRSYMVCAIGRTRAHLLTRCSCVSGVLSWRDAARFFG